MSGPYFQNILKYGLNMVLFGISVGPVVVEENDTNRMLQSIYALSGHMLQSNSRSFENLIAERPADWGISTGYVALPPNPIAYGTL